MSRAPAKSGGKQDRDNRGRFRAGSSGNPCGRTAGSRNRASLLADRLAEDEAEEIVRVVLAAAKSGEPWAAEIICKRMWPIRRGRPTPLRLPPIDSAADVPRALVAVLAAVATGELTSAEATDLAGIVEVIRRGYELADIEERLRRLEEAQP